MYQNAYFDGRTIHLWDDKLGYKKFSNKRYAYLPNKNGKFVALDGSRVKRFLDMIKNLKIYMKVMYQLLLER